MNLYPKLILKNGKEQALDRKHPWIFSGAIYNIDPKLGEGDVAEVWTSKGNYLATGHYTNGSIMVRILSFDKRQLDATFWKDRIQSAYGYRKRCNLAGNDATNCFRLIHGEGDGLPGLVVDVYGSTVVVQPHSPGMSKAAADIAKAIEEVLPNVTNIYLKPADTNNHEERFIKGELTEEVVYEHGNQFKVNWQTGQKTGFFLDQRDNRKLLGQYVNGKRVLNAFCYSGGFSVYAAKAGASMVHSVDSSSKAIGWTNDNAKLNNVEQNHEAYCEDVMQFLKQVEEPYEVMVLDPPAYAKHLSARHRAVQGYKRLNVMGLQKLAPGGILFTFSCSQVVDRELFYNTIVAAAIEAGRNIRVMHHLSQPADHPVNIFHPEGAYLKGLALYVE